MSEFQAATGGGEDGETIMSDWELNKAPCEQLAGSRPKQMTPRERLESKKRYLEADLKQVNEALDALTAHPDIEKVFELVGLAL